MKYKLCAMKEPLTSGSKNPTKNLGERRSFWKYKHCYLLHLGWSYWLTPTSWPTSYTRYWNSVLHCSSFLPCVPYVLNIIIFSKHSHSSFCSSLLPLCKDSFLGQATECIVVLQQCQLWLHVFHTLNKTRKAYKISVIYSVTDHGHSQHLSARMMQQE